MTSAKYQNCFDLLRLILAGAVVYTHSYLLGGFGTEGFLDFNKGQTIAGRVAVLGFFGLSGYLVTASFIKRNSPTSYLLSRIKRIFPAFLVLTKYLPFFLAFATGALLQLFREHTRLDAPQTIGLALAALVLLKFGGWNLCAPVLLPILLINVAELVTVRLKHDLSYGIYIYGFPCQHLLAAMEWPRSHFLLFFGCSLAASAFCASLSWFLVERRFLYGQRAKKSPNAVS